MVLGLVFEMASEFWVPFVSFCGLALVVLSVEKGSH
jgi:hypothetical protein